MTAPAGDTVVVRPRRLTLVCRGTAVVVVVLFAVVARALGGGPAGDAQFRLPDQIAFFLLGCLIAGAVLLFTRSRVEADVEGVSVRNPMSSKRIPGQVVRSVRMDEGAPWASLELQDDETVQLLGVQSNDGDRAVEAVLALRQLLRRSRAGDSHT